MGVLPPFLSCSGKRDKAQDSHKQVIFISHSWVNERKENEMPNHCHNFLEIYSPDDGDIKTVLDAIKGGERLIDFNKLIPYPEKYAALDLIAREYEELHPSDPWNGRPKDGFNQGGYEWCVENWETKWNAYKIELISQDESQAIIKFETAWCAPMPVIDKLAEMFPAFTFTLEWYERGKAQCGSRYYEDGELKEEAKGDYVGFRGG